MHTGSPPLSRTQAPLPGHSLDCPAGVVQRWEQNCTVLRVEVVLDKHRGASDPQGSSRLHAP